jgi:hypothetical protein
VALAAIETSHTLANNDDLIIFAGGVDTSPDLRIDTPSDHKWSWRTGGGGWTLITSASATIKSTTGTDLVNDGDLADANRRANAGGTYIVSGQEFEADADGILQVSARVENGEVTEGQIALDFSGAVEGTEYEFSCEWDEKNDGLTRIIYTAKITTAPVLAEGLEVWRRHPARALLVR